MNLALRQVTAHPRWTRQFGGCLTAATLMRVACSSRKPGGVASTVQGQAPDGTVEMHEVQAAYIGSGSGGGTMDR